MTTIEEVLSRVNPKVAEKFQLASTVENKNLSTPSLGINDAIKGFGHGRISLLWGNRGASKTAVCAQAAGIAQRQGMSVAWIDAERNFDPEWTARLGMDNTAAAVSKIGSIADFTDAAVDFITAGVDVLVVDSISALLPQSFLTDDGELKPFENTGQIGTFSKNIGSSLNMINSINKHTVVIIISQVRTNIGSYGSSPTYMGGKAVEHLISTEIKFWANPNEKEAIKARAMHNNIIIEKPVGRPVTWTVGKNRGPGLNMSGTFDFYFAGEHVGVDRTGEVIDFAVLHGLIKKGGAWYTYQDTKLQGKPAMVMFLKSNPDIEEELYQEIMSA